MTTVGLSSKSDAGLLNCPLIKQMKLPYSNAIQLSAIVDSDDSECDFEDLESQLNHGDKHCDNDSLDLTIASK